MKMRIPPEYLQKVIELCPESAGRGTQKRPRSQGPSGATRAERKETSGAAKAAQSASAASGQPEQPPTPTPPSPPPQPTSDPGWSASDSENERTGAGVRAARRMRDVKQARKADEDNAPGAEGPEQEALPPAQEAAQPEQSAEPGAAVNIPPTDAPPAHWFTRDQIPGELRCPQGTDHPCLGKQCIPCSARRLAAQFPAMGPQDIQNARVTNQTLPNYDARYDPARTTTRNSPTSATRRCSVCSPASSGAWPSCARA